MKIHNISFNSAYKPHQQLRFTGNKPVNQSDSELVYTQNYSKPRTFTLSDRLYESDIEKEDEISIPDIIFRNDELFDKRRDEVTDDYSSYDEDDIKPVREQFYYPFNPDYLINKDEYFDTNECFNTDILQPNAYELMMKHYAIVNNIELHGNNDIYMDAIKLTRYGKRTINGKLRKELEKKLDHYDIKTAATVANTAKLQDRNFNESVNYDLFEDGFKLAKRYPAEDVEQMMNSCVLEDRFCNEYYSPATMNFIGRLLTDLSAEEASTCAEHVVTRTEYDGVRYDHDKAYNIFKLLKIYPKEEALARIEKINPDTPIDNES